MKKEVQMLLFQTYREIKIFFNILYRSVFIFWEKNWGHAPPPAPVSYEQLGLFGN